MVPARQRILALREEPLRRGTRVKEDLAPPQRPGRVSPGGPAPRMGRMRALGLSGAAPGRKPRATGPNRGWVVDLRPRADPVGVLAAPRLPPEPALSAASSAGPPARARGTDNAASAPGRARSGRARSAAARTSGGLVHTTDPSACPVAHTRRLVQEGTRGLRRSRGILLRGRPRPSPGQAPCKRGTRRGATAPGERTRRPRQPRRPDGRSWHQPHPPPPHQRRRPPTHNRRTPLQSQPHHHPTHHRITNPPQNPGLSRRVWSVCANGAGVVGVWAEDLLGRCIEHCR